MSGSPKDKRSDSATLYALIIALAAAIAAPVAVWIIWQMIKMLAG